MAVGMAMQPDRARFDFKILPGDSKKLTLCCAAHKSTALPRNATAGADGDGDGDKHPLAGKSFDSLTPSDLKRKFQLPCGAHPEAGAILGFYDDLGHAPVKATLKDLCQLKKQGSHCPHGCNAKVSPSMLGLGRAEKLVISECAYSWCLGRVVNHKELPGGITHCAWCGVCRDYMYAHCSRCGECSYGSHHTLFPFACCHDMVLLHDGIAFVPNHDDAPCPPKPADRISGMIACSCCNGSELWALTGSGGVNLSTRPRKRAPHRGGRGNIPALTPDVSKGAGVSEFIDKEEAFARSLGIIEQDWRAPTTPPPKRFEILQKTLQVLDPTHLQLRDERTQQGIDRSLPDDYDYKTNREQMEELANTGGAGNFLAMMEPAYREFAKRLHAASFSSPSSPEASSMSVVDFIADLHRKEAAKAQEFLEKKAQEKLKQRQSRKAGGGGGGGGGGAAAAAAVDDDDDDDGGSDGDDEDEGGRVLGSESRSLTGELMCASCGVHGDTTNALSACPCKEVLYCSSQCQKLDWKEHKLSCKARNGGGRKKKP